MSALDWVASVAFLLGCALNLIAAIGALRFPDLLSRMHAATKPQVLGLMLMMTGLAASLGSSQLTWKLLIVVLFQFMTAPVSAHMVGRSGYRTGKVREDTLVVDELTEDLARAKRIAEGQSSS